MRERLRDGVPLAVSTIELAWPDVERPDADRYSRRFFQRVRVGTGDATRTIMLRFQTQALAVFVLALGSWTACGGKATGDTVPGGSTSGGTDGGSSGGEPDASDDAAASGCTSARGCPLPAGLVCPTPEDPRLTGTTKPVDRSCLADMDCVSVVFQTDCCGNTLAFGVNSGSASSAKNAADTCQRGFPGCGCPARPTVAETGLPDGGQPMFDAPIDAYCASGTCKTRYR
jgi:hypothetical protein